VNRGGRRGSVGRQRRSGGGVPEGGGEVAKTLPRDDVVLAVCLAGAERGWSVGMMARPSGGGARAHRHGSLGCVGAGNGIGLLSKL
jgi:hypothetical protein